MTIAPLVVNGVQFAVNFDKQSNETVYSIHEILVDGNLVSILTGTYLPVTLPNGISPYHPIPLGYQQITPTVATGLTIPSTATYCLITIEGNGVRYRDDGTAPTATVGMLLADGTQSWPYYGPLSAIEFIPVSGTTATVNVAYYK